MDGHHHKHGHDDGHRRGGRGTPTRVYRRVVSDATDASNTKKDDGDDDAPARPAFKSSLLQSLATDKENEAASRKTPTASLKSRGGRGRGHGNTNATARDASPPKSGPRNGRRVDLTTTDESVAPVRTQRVSSIESSTSTSSKTTRWVRKDGDHGDPPTQQPFGSGVNKSAQDVRYGNSNGSGNGDRKASQRDALRRSESDVSYRRVELSRDRRSSFRSNRGRSDSVESDASVHSVQSVQSTQSTRSTRSRYDSKSQSSRYDYKPRRSNDDRLSLTSDRPPSRGRMERSTSDVSSARDHFRDRDREREDRGNRRFQDERPARHVDRSTSDHSETEAPSRSTLATPVRGSTLASSSLLKTTAPVIVTKPLAKSSQDVRFAGGSSAPPTKFKSSLASSLAVDSGPKTQSDTQPPSSSPVPAFKSSLAAAASPNSTATDDKKTVDDAERRRLAAERLKEGFAARKGAPGSSLSQLASKSSLQSSAETPSNVPQSSSPTRTARPDSSIQSRVGDRAPAQSDKEARTREFFAKLQKEDAQRETARRAENTFKSSLTSSIAAAPTKPTVTSLTSSIATAPTKPTLKETLAARGVTPFKSSLKDSIAARQAASATPVMNKTVYSLADLRKLMPTSPVKCPPDLRDMRIVEVIEEQAPKKLKSSSLASGRRVEVSSRKGGSGKRGGVGRGGAQGGKMGSKGDRQRSGGGGGGGGRRGGPPPPPLFDGPVEPLTVSENRWVPKKTDKSEFETILSHVKSVLNKLTREKFAKLTDELCSTAIDNMEMLGSIIGAIMNKAIEEPNFADVYADLCKEFHVRTASKTWSFLRAAERVEKPNTFSWTVVRKDDSSGFVGPFPSEKECIDAANSSVTSQDSAETTNQDMWSATLHVTSDALIAVVKATKNAFFYKKKALDSLTEYEPVFGEFASADAAIQVAAKDTSFKRLLVTRCQMEFEKFNKTTQTTDDTLDQRQKDLQALRLKRLMLGNMRFIGELFKVDLLNQTVVQQCLFYLLGLELVKDPTDDHLAGQVVRLPDEEDIEALCKLLATVGKKYDQPKTQTIMRIVILRLVELSDEKELPSRARFLLKDVLEMRDHLWQPRRKEMQQKTLEEVRREAMQLQSQGKNAQHDDLKQRRLKSQISSVQLAKQSSNLLVRKDTLSESAATDTDTSTTGAEDGAPRDANIREGDHGKIETRIKSIIQEFTSIHDIEEASACVRELPRDRLVDFAEAIVNRALEGKDQERNDVVNLLVKLYEGGVVDAMSIQLALVNVMEFLEDIKIDIPLVHQYSALLFGRLIAAGCFGLSWMLSTALPQLVDDGLASLVFAETLPVIEAESDERTVIRMVTDEEVSAASVLPRSLRRDEAAIANYVEEHDLAVYFGAERPQEDGEEEDELDPDVEAKLRSTLNEYLSVKDLDEVVLCVNELGEDLWRHFVRVAVTASLDAKQAMRLDVAALFYRLITERSDDVDVEDVEWAFETALIDYEDVRVDVPRLAHNFAELWSPLFEKPECLTLAWLYEAVAHLLATGDAADLLDALLTRVESKSGREDLVEWWLKQKPSDASGDWLKAFSGQDATIVHARLVPWQTVFGAAHP